MTKHTNIGIAGAGIMGRLLAWQLTEAGHRVTLFDKDPITTGSAAAYTAAGMLTPYTEAAVTDDHIYSLGKQSLALWPKIVKRLGSNVAYHNKGSLIIAHPNDRSDHTRFKNNLERKLTTHIEEYQHVDIHTLKHLEPALSENFSEATYLPNEAWLYPNQIMQSLAKKLLDNQVLWHTHSSVTATKANHLTYGGRNYHFDCIVDCRGLGAKPEMNALRGVRGELICIEAKKVNISRLVRLIHPRYCLYLVPQENNCYIIGATQIESHDFGPITVRSTLELLSALYSIHPEFSEARLIDTRTNCRPALKNNLPIIEFKQGLVRANGLFRHGFLLAPVIANEICHWISDTEHHQSPFKNLFKEIA